MKTAVKQAYSDKRAGWWQRAAQYKQVYILLLPTLLIYLIFS